MTSPIYILMRASLIPVWAGTLLVQALIYPQAIELSRGYSEVEHLALPYALLGIVAMIGIQIALVFVWQLSVLAEQDRVFSETACPKVTGVIIGVGVFCAFAIAPTIHLLFVVQAGGPGTILFSAAITTCGVALILVLLVMRNLLSKAAQAHGELLEVI